MLSTELTASIVNPYVIYGLLAFYGLVIVGVLAYVHTKFKGASLLLKSLKDDWDTADHRHKSILTEAKAQVSKLAPAPQTVMTAASAASKPAVTFDTRNQVVTMGRKGFTASDIARSCGLPEGDVDVLLGLARIQRN